MNAGNPGGCFFFWSPSGLQLQRTFIFQQNIDEKHAAKAEQTQKMTQRQFGG